jgi:hypothetical protein
MPAVLFRENNKTLPFIWKITNESVKWPPLDSEPSAYVVSALLSLNPIHISVSP